MSQLKHIKRFYLLGLEIMIGTISRHSDAPRLGISMSEYKPPGFSSNIGFLAFDVYEKKKQNA